LILLVINIAYSSYQYHAVTTGWLVNNIFTGANISLVGDMNINGYLDTNQLCINMDCKSSWSEVQSNVTYDKVQNYSSHECPAGQAAYTRLQNGTFLCRTLSSGDTDTWWNISDDYYLDNVSQHLILNRTKLNATIDNRDSDTTYTAGSNLTLDGTTFNWDSVWIKTNYAVSSIIKNWISGNFTLLDNKIDAVNTSTNINNLFTDDLTVDLNTANCSVDNSCDPITYDTELAYISNCSGANCDIGWGNLTGVPADIADGDDVGAGDNNCSVDNSCTLITYDSELSYTTDTNCTLEGSCPLGTYDTELQNGSIVRSQNTSWITSNQNYNTTKNMQDAINQSTYYYDINTNRSYYWDNLNSPSDIGSDDITDDGTWITPTNNNAQELAINESKLNITDQRYNDTAFVISTNSSMKAYADSLTGTGNSTADIWAAVNNGTFVYIGTKLGNTTAEIKTAGFNFTTELETYFDGIYYEIDGKIGNTTAEIWSIVNNGTFVTIGTKLGNTTSEIKSAGFNLTTELETYFDLLYFAIDGKVGNTTSEIWSIANNGTLVNINYVISTNASMKAYVDATAADTDTWNSSTDMHREASILITDVNTSITNMNTSNRAYIDSFDHTYNSSFNQTLTDTLYADISLDDTDTWNSSTDMHREASILITDVNATIAALNFNSSFNQTLTDTLYADISVIDTDTWNSSTDMHREASILITDVNTSRTNMNTSNRAYISAEDNLIRINITNLNASNRAWVTATFMAIVNVNLQDTTINTTWDNQNTTNYAHFMSIAEQMYNDTAFVISTNASMKAYVDSVAADTDTWNSTTDMHREASILITDVNTSRTNMNTSNRAFDVATYISITNNNLQETATNTSRTNMNTSNRAYINSLDHTDNWNSTTDIWNVINNGSIYFTTWIDNMNTSNRAFTVSTNASMKAYVDTVAADTDTWNSTTDMHREASILITDVNTSITKLNDSNRAFDVATYITISNSDTNDATINSTLTTKNTSDYATFETIANVDAKNSDQNDSITQNANDILSTKNWSADRGDVAFTNESNTFTEHQIIQDNLSVTGNITADVIKETDIELDYLSGSTYTTLQDWIDTMQSAGLLTGGEITKNDNNTINVSAGTGFIKTIDSAVGNSVLFDWAASSYIPLTVNNTKHRVYIDYNSGSPIVKVTTSSLDFTTELGIGTAEYEVYPNSDGSMHTELHAAKAGTQTYNLARRIQQTLRGQGFQRVYGAIIGGRGLNITLTASAFDGGLNRFTQPAYDSNATSFENYYYNGSTWFVSEQNIINNTHYNLAGNGLVPLTVNRYGVHWIYLDIIDDHVAVVYGTGDYTLTNAQASTAPASLPNYLADYAVLVGRVIVQKGAGSFTEVSSAFDTTFVQSAAQDHGELAGLTDDDHDGIYYTETEVDDAITSANSSMKAYADSVTGTGNSTADIWNVVNNNTFLYQNLLQDFIDDNLTAYNISIVAYIDSQTDTDTWNSTTDIHREASILITDVNTSRTNMNTSNRAFDAATYITITNNNLQELAINESKLNISDQRYNDTDFVISTNTSMKSYVDSVSDTHNQSLEIWVNVVANNTFLDLTDQMYNDTAFVISTNTSMKEYVDSIAADTTIDNCSVSGSCDTIVYQSGNASLNNLNATGFLYSRIDFGVGEEFDGMPLSEGDNNIFLWDANNGYLVIGNFDDTDLVVPSGNNYGSVSMGYNSLATDVASFAMGWNCKAYGAASICMQEDSYAGGDKSISIGHFVESTGTNSRGFGSNINVTHSDATVMGVGLGSISGNKLDSVLADSFAIGMKETYPTFLLTRANVSIRGNLSATTYWLDGKSISSWDEVNSSATDTNCTLEGSCPLITYDTELQNGSIVRSQNTSWITSNQDYNETQELWDNVVNNGTFPTKADMTNNITSANSSMKAYVDSVSDTHNQSLEIWVNVVANNTFLDLTDQRYNNTAFVISTNESMKEYVDNVAADTDTWNSSTDMHREASILITDVNTSRTNMNTSNRAYINSLDHTDNWNSTIDIWNVINNGSLYFTTWIDNLNTSNRAFVISTNSSMKAYVDTIDTDTWNDSLDIWVNVVANNTFLDLTDQRYNNTAFVISTNSSMKAYVDEVAADTDTWNSTTDMHREASILITDVNTSRTNMNTSNRAWITSEDNLIRINITNLNASNRAWVIATFQTITGVNTLISSVNTSITNMNASNRAYTVQVNASMKAYVDEVASDTDTWNSTTDMHREASILITDVNTSRTNMNTSNRAYINSLDHTDNWNSTIDIWNVINNGSIYFTTWIDNMNTSNRAFTVSTNASMKAYVDSVGSGVSVEDNNAQELAINTTWSNQNTTNYAVFETKINIASLFTSTNLTFTNQNTTNYVVFGTITNRDILFTSTNLTFTNQNTTNYAVFYDSESDLTTLLDDNYMSIANSDINDGSINTSRDNMNTSIYTQLDLKVSIVNNNLQETAINTTAGLKLTNNTAITPLTSNVTGMFMNGSCITFPNGAKIGNAC